MAGVIFRRRLLGLTSVTGVAESSQSGLTVRTHNPLRRTARREGAWPDTVDIVFRWGCTAALPVRCNNVVNSAEAIHAVNDKAGFRRTLMQHHLDGGDLLCPRTYTDPNPATLALGNGVVVRPRNHAQGRRFFVCRTQQELRDALARCGDGAYASDLIDKAAEYRVFVCQGRAVWVAQKTPGNPGDVAWNVARGGMFTHVRWGDWPLKVVKVAIAGFNLSGLHFGGVDVIVDRQGNCYIVEINSAPSQTSPHRQECVARAFDYIVANGKDTIPLITQRGGWRKFIHPGVSTEAMM